MTHLGTMAILEPAKDLSRFGLPVEAGRPSVMIVRDAGKDNALLDSICEFLDVEVEHITGDDDLRAMLLTVRPAVVIADLAGEAQDGFHVMKIAATYDPSLPILLLGEDDPALLGAADAIQEVFGLTNVASATSARDVGIMVDFLCHAIRDAGIPGLMRL